MSICQCHTVGLSFVHGVGVSSGNSVNPTFWICHTLSFAPPVWKYFTVPACFSSSFARRSVRKLYPAALALLSMSLEGIAPPASSSSCKI